VVAHLVDDVNDEADVHDDVDDNNDVTVKLMMISSSPGNH
jgi:hypothetical protein